MTASEHSRVAHDEEQSSWKRELGAFGRAFSGAFLFGVPLLFTMEMWWIGTYADLWKLVVFLLLALSANLGLTYFAGFKQNRTALQFIDQAIDAVAVGVVGSFVVLVVLNRISLSDPLDSIVGKIIVQAVPLSIGASLANIVFNKGEGRQGEDSALDRPWLSLVNDIGATAIGGIFIGFSIAPTDEVPMLAAGMSFPHELALVGLTLFIGYLIVFVSGFDPEVHGQQQPGLFQRPLTETTLAYLVSLIVALVALFLFDRIEVRDPLQTVVSQTLVLGMPTMVGGAAGRLAV